MRYDDFRKMLQDQPARGNRKVIGATRNERDGVVFASRLERTMYDLLGMHGIRFEFQKRYVLQEAFDYCGQRVREIGYTADFYLPDQDMLIDTKGHQTQQGALRIKMLKHQFATAGIKTRILLPRDRTECESIIRTIIDSR